MFLFPTLQTSRDRLPSPLAERGWGRRIFFLPSPLPDIASDVTPLHKWRGGRERGNFFSPLSACREGSGERKLFFSPLRSRRGVGGEVTKNPNMIYLIIFVELRWRFGKSPVHS